MIQAPELQPYLTRLGQIVQAVTGDQPELQRAASDWRSAAAGCRRALTTLSDAGVSLAQWQGDTRDACDRLRRRLEREFAGYATRADRIAVLLDHAAVALTEASSITVASVEAFVSEAEIEWRMLLTLPPALAAAGYAQYLSDLHTRFLVHHARARQAESALDQELGRAAGEVNGMEPGFLDAVRDRVTEFFTEDLWERIHDLADVQRRYGRDLGDLGLLRLVDEVGNNPALRVVHGEVSSYAGINLTAKDCTLLSGAAAAGVRPLPVKLGLGVLATACGVLHGTTMPRSLEPVGQVMLGWGPDAALLPDGVAVRGSLRSLEKGRSTLVLGRSTGLSATLAAPPDLRWTCSDSHGITLAVPNGPIGLNLGGWASASLDASRFAAGTFAELEIALPGHEQARTLSLKRAGTVRAITDAGQGLDTGSPNCGVSLHYLNR